MKHSIPGLLKRISEEEVENYRELDIYDKDVCTQAVAFTLNPSNNQHPGSLYDSKWEEVTYYGDSNTATQHPLEILLDEWREHSIVQPPSDPRNLPG